MEATRRPRVLCVDDEPQVLEGLALNLRRRYEVEKATSGAAGLEVLARAGADIAVIVSDMRMPDMDGSTFLARARELAPDAARILLTGQADLSSAIAAVNDGQIGHFLTKPCAIATLFAAVQAGVEQHRLRTAERVLLEETLRGSIAALTDVLALTAPLSFGRATRIKQCAAALAAKLGLAGRWQLEVAAMLSQLGCITLPEDTAAKLYYGQPLGSDEAAMVANLPAVTEQLLAKIPRLEVVREILGDYGKPYRPGHAGQDPAKKLVERAAAILRIAVDFDALEAQGQTAALAVDTLRGRGERYAPDVLAALVELHGASSARPAVRELRVSGLRLGMTFAEDVKLAGGQLLVTRGYEVTTSFLERVRNFRPGTIREPLRVVAVAAGKEAA